MSTHQPDCNSSLKSCKGGVALAYFFGRGAKKKKEKKRRRIFWIAVTPEKLSRIYVRVHPNA